MKISPLQNGGGENPEKSSQKQFIFLIMSYTKIQVRYYGDGIACNGRNTRQGVEKKVTITLPKRVIEYGDKHGYSRMVVDYRRYNRDHIIIKGGGETLLDKDINGGSNEYIERIVGYEWL